jgi:hypothetical protein
VSSFPLVKYVDSPATTATVRYDFNDQTGTPAKKVTEFDPGVPTLEGDPDAVGQQWGFRTPSITHTIRGTKAQAMAALSAVSKEQLRRTNWVLFQPSAATQPVWFKTYRTGYQPISLDRVYVRVEGGGTAPVPDTWKITVPLVADAFAYGARVSLGPYTVSQAPSGTNPMQIVLPAIRGEAPTNLRVSLQPTSTTASGSSWLLGTWSAAASQTSPQFEIGLADGNTATGGTGAGTSDATYFGGSYRTFSVAAATPNLLQRLSGSWASSSIPFGRYKVMLRYEIDAPASTIQALFRLFVWNTNAALAAASTVNLTGGAGNQQGWVDLGEITVPAAGQVPVDAGFTSSSSLLWALHIGTASGVAMTGKLDAFKLIPVDGPNVSLARNLKVQCNTFLPIDGFSVGYFDGDDEAFWAVQSGTIVNNTPSLTGLVGSYPRVDPAAGQNVLTVMATGKGQGVAIGITPLNATATVNVWYSPRYLHVGDGT